MGCVRSECRIRIRIRIRIVNLTTVMLRFVFQQVADRYNRSQTAQNGIGLTFVGASQEFKDWVALELPGRYVERPEMREGGKKLRGRRSPAKRAASNNNRDPTQRF